MESEHLKSINELVKISRGPVDKQEEEGKPFLERKTQDIVPLPSSPSSSCSSTLEFDIDEESSFDNPSVTPASLISSPATHQWGMGVGLTPPEGKEFHLFPESSQMKYPSTQTMVHPPGYDPNRIPASVFSTSPGEWSLTSNESLFSIQMGNNNSFSGDHAILFGKSSEFPRLDDWTSELSSLPPVMEVSAHEECSSVRSRKASGTGNDDSDSNSPTVAAVDTENLGKPHQVPHVVVTNNTPPHVRNVSSPRISASNPRMSDVSGHSGSSFAFPVLLGDGGKSNDSLKVSKDMYNKPDQKPHEQSRAQVSKAPSTTNKPKASNGKCCCWSCWSCWPRCC